MRIAAILAATALVTAACSGGDEQEPENADETATAAWTEQQVVDHLGLEPDPAIDGSYTYGDCEIPLVLTTQQMVEMYRDAGDTVPTTPDGTAGVKVVGDCGDELAAQLETISTE